MISYNIHNETNFLIHEFALHRMNRDAIHQMTGVLENIFTVNDGCYKYILIDASQVEMLFLELLASKLKYVVLRHTYQNFHMTLVVDKRLAFAASENLLKTMLRSDNVEIFTSIDKARLWLKLLM